MLLERIESGCAVAEHALAVRDDLFFTLRMRLRSSITARI